MPTIWEELRQIAEKLTFPNAVGNEHGIKGQVMLPKLDQGYEQLRAICAKHLAL